MKLLECVPNFSEGKNQATIDAIKQEFNKVKGVKLVDIQSGRTANRTVMTVMGEAANVVKATFNAIRKASQLIDMTQQQGTHPRIGATDVCPLIPLKNITMEEVVEFSYQLAHRVGNELNIPVYCYENSALEEEKADLAFCRKGGYEALAGRMRKGFEPDFGNSRFNAKAGATVIGARDFLVAYNVNIGTTDVKLAKQIAEKIRERSKEGLKNVKAIGWYIEEYGFAQVSINLTDYKKMPIHTVLEKVVCLAKNKGVRVVGAELIGLMPLKCLTEAGKYYLKKQGKSSDILENELIDVAVEGLMLDNFNPSEKIIEYVMEQCKF